jgi:RNA polymerase sigma factor (sigma-70 family)
MTACTCTWPAQWIPESLAFWAAPRVKRPMVQNKTHTPLPLTTAPPAGTHEDLLTAVGTHQDRTAFASLFDYFAPRIKSYLIKHGATDAAAEEIVQNTFVTIWEKAARYDRAKAAASTWIFTVARNKRIDALRREKFIDVDSDNAALANASYSPEDTYVDAATVEKLTAAIHELPPEQADLLQMAYFEDKSHQAIADETRIPLGTVKSRLRLGLEKLRQRFAPDDTGAAS